MTSDVKNAIVNRSNALLPFYKCSPFYYIFIKNQNNIEVACVHGGFVNNLNDEEFIKLQNYQRNLNNKITDFNNNFEDVLNILNNENSSILWSRNYARLDEMNRPKCNILKFPFTVVGHCPTAMSKEFSNNDSFSYINQLLEERNNKIGYSQVACDTNLEGQRGCVALGCVNEEGRPELAFVDIAMSHAFFNNQIENKNRIIEVLKLFHNTKHESDNFYYNHISLVITTTNRYNNYLSPSSSTYNEEKIWFSKKINNSQISYEKKSKDTSPIESSDSLPEPSIIDSSSISQPDNLQIQSDNREKELSSEPSIIESPSTSESDNREKEISSSEQSKKDEEKSEPSKQNIETLTDEIINYISNNETFSDKTILNPEKYELDYYKFKTFINENKNWTPDKLNNIKTELLLKFSITNIDDILYAISLIDTLL
jgi:hypothetical protein